MPRIAFYAPLKPPDHPVPSGDRRVAQLFLAALHSAGYRPFVASRLRSYDAVGDPRRQARLASQGGRIAAALVERWRRLPDAAPVLWFTYHLYYKAPDSIGPAVAQALGIPYVVAEASFAAKRAGGPWDLSHRAVERALRRADAVIGVNSADRSGVLPLLAEPGRWLALPPFVDARAFRAVPPRPGSASARLIVLAMMRHGDKLASYRVLGEALARVLDLPWSLTVIGDGPARAEVEAALAPLGDRVFWRGQLGPNEVAAALAAADLCVWPAINEAFGMALLEAQASGVPVVAGATGGVGDVVASGETGLLSPAGDAAAFAEAVRALLLYPGRRQAMAEAAWRRVRRDHDLPVATAALAARFARLRMARAA